jgi:hypothetical protein
VFVNMSSSREHNGANAAMKHSPQSLNLVQRVSLTAYGEVPRLDPASLQGRKICVIVCGMHRTGTSAMTRVVNLLGADIAKQLVEPKPDNIRGYWEASAIVGIHNDLLQGLGTSSADPLPLQEGWLQSVSAQEARCKLASMIKSEFADSDLFVVKDPRLSRLLPLWLDLLDELGIEAVVVVPFRNPLEVAASLKARDRMSLATSLILYAYSYLDTERASRGRRRCFVGYNRFLEDWHELERKLRDILGARLPSAGDEQSKAIESYLTSDLRHHRFSRDELDRLPHVPGIVVDLFDRLNDAADRGDSAPLRRSFDEIRRHADDAILLFRELIISERAVLNEHIHTMEGSTSWRLTAPLRWIKDRPSVWARSLSSRLRSQP